MNCIVHEVTKSCTQLSNFHFHFLTSAHDYCMVLTIQTFVSKVMSLLFNTLSRLVIAFPPRSKCLKFTAAVTVCSDFGAQEKKSGHELGSLLSAHYTPLLATRNIATRATCRK